MTDKKYLELSDKVLLATMLERMDNLIDRFDDHLVDDKEIANNVHTLITKEARLDSRIILLSTLCTTAGFIVGKLPIKWF